MKNEGSSKRKLSKRKDPEAAVSFYHEEGFPIESVLEYLLNIANSNFEDWRRNNPNTSLWEFPFKLDKMGNSGALFDLVKLTDMSKNVISAMTSERIYKEVLNWSKEFDKPFAETLVKNQEKVTKFLNIDRTGKKPRKDISKWSEVKSTLTYIIDNNFSYDFPENISTEEIKNIIEKYSQVYNHNDTKEEWFNRIKDFSESLGYAKDTKLYKQNPESYKGSITDTSTVIRVSLTGRKQTPDLYEIIQVLGYEETITRFNRVFK